MHRHASSILLLKCLCNYLKAIKKTLLGMPRQTHFADFEQVIIKISHFADFEQVKQYYQQNFHGRNRMPSHFFLRPLPCVTATPHWLVRPMKASTSWALPQHWAFLNAYTSSFLIPHTWLMGHHAAPGVTHTHPGKWRISLGVAVILGTCLCPHT